MPSSTGNSIVVTERGDTGSKVADEVDRERYAWDDVPYTRCEHGQFEGACVACWYKNKYPQLCS
jgi:hypothetical protein